MPAIVQVSPALEDASPEAVPARLLRRRRDLFPMRIDRPIVWKGTGVEEKGVDAKTGQTLIEVDPRYFRPTEVDLLIGDPSKAETKLGWKPKRTFDELVTDMVDSDMELFKQEAHRVNRYD